MCLKDKKYEDTFIQKIFDRWFDLWAEKELYDFLILLIKYWNDWKK